MGAKCSQPGVKIYCHACGAAAMGHASHVGRRHRKCPTNRKDGGACWKTEPMQESAQAADAADATKTE